MSAHDAEYFRRRGRVQGIPARGPFSAPEFPRQATEPRRLEQLPWPRNLFGELASIAELMAESAHAGENADGACSCIPPFNAVCPSSGGSREEVGLHDIRAREDDDGFRPRAASRDRQQRRRLTPPIPNPIAVRRNTMGAYITAAGIAFGLLAIWAALVPLVG
jgi:hypothetical protein